MKRTENILEEIDEDMSSIKEEEEEKHPPEEMNSSKLIKDKLNKLNRKKFSFFFKRTCFRLMVDYYRQTFYAFVKTKKVHSHLKTYITNFTMGLFGHVIDSLPDLVMKKDFSSYLTMIVHAHRHNNASLLNMSVSSTNSEDQSFSDLDFSVIRDTMYKYSQKAHLRFFSVAELCFLFIDFANNQLALSRTKQRLHGKGVDYQRRIMADIEEMKNEAFTMLQQQAQLRQSEKAQCYLNLLTNKNLEGL